MCGLGLSQVEEEVGELDIAARSALTGGRLLAELVHDRAAERGTLEVVQWRRADALDERQQLGSATLHDVPQEHDLVADKASHCLHNVMIALRHRAVGQ
jgi:hypothetical protein